MAVAGAGEAVVALLEGLGDSEASGVLAALRTLSHKGGADAGESLVNQYLATSSSCIELLSCWDDLAAGRTKPAKGEEIVFVTAIMEALAAVLLRGDKKRFGSGMRQLSKNVMIRKSRAINQFLASTRDMKYMRSLLMLLSGIVAQGASVARELLHRVSCESETFYALAEKGLGLKHGSASVQSRYGSTRHRYQQFVLALLTHADVSVKKRILQPRGMVQRIFRKIATDPRDMAESFLSGLRKYVLKDSAVGRRTKQAFFHPLTTLVTGLVPMYNNEDTADLAHDFLTDLLLTPETCIFRPGSAGEAGGDLDKGAAATASEDKRQCFLMVINSMSPLSSTSQDELVLRVLRSEPQLQGRYFSSVCNRLHLEPRASFSWLKALRFLRRLLELPIPPPAVTLGKLSEASGSLSDGQWQRVAEALLGFVLPSEKAVPKVLLSRGAQHSSSLVVTQTLDLLALFMHRADRAGREAANYLQTLDLSSRGPARLRYHIRNCLTQRIPHTSVLVALLSAASGPQNKEWAAPETDWVQLRAARLLRQYFSMCASAHVAKADIAKLLNNICEAAAAAGGLSEAQFMSQVSLVQCIPKLKRFDRWTQGQSLRNACLVRARACALGAPVAALDDALAVLFRGILALEPSPDQRTQSLAWVAQLRDPASADFVAKLVLDAARDSGLTSMSSLVRMAFALSADDRAQRRVVLRAVVRLVHRSEKVAAGLDAEIVTALCADADGFSFARYASQTLGLVPGNMLPAKSPARGAKDTESRHVALADPQPEALLATAADPMDPEASVANVLAGAEQATLFSPQVWANAQVYNALVESISTCSAGVAVSVACQLSRLVGSYVGRCGKKVNERDCGLAFDLLDAVLDAYPAALRAALTHPVVRDTKVLPLGLQIRVAGLVEHAHLRSAELSTCSEHFECPEQLELLGSWLEELESKPDVAAPALLAARHCVVHHAQRGALALPDVALYEWNSGEARTPAEAQLGLFLLSRSAPSSRTFRALAQASCTGPVSAEADAAFYHVAKALVTDWDLARANAAPVAAVVRDKAFRKQALALWKRPSPTRVKTLALLVAMDSKLSKAVFKGVAQVLDELKHSQQFGELLRHITTLFAADRAAFGCGLACLSSQPTAMLALMRGLARCWCDLDASGCEMFTWLLAHGGDPATKEGLKQLEEHVGAADLAGVGLKEHTLCFLLRQGRAAFHGPLLTRVLCAVAHCANEVVDWESLKTAWLSAPGTGTGTDTGTGTGRPCAFDSAGVASALVALFQAEHASAAARCALFFLVDTSILAIDETVARALIGASFFQQGLISERLEEREACLRLLLLAAEGIPEAVFSAGLERQLRARYSGTLSRADCIIRRVLQCFENRGLSTLEENGFAIGRDAVDEALVPVPPQQESLTSIAVLSPFLSARFGFLLKANFRASLGKDFPVNRALAPSSVLPVDMEAADTSAAGPQHRKRSAGGLGAKPVSKRAKTESSRAMETYDELFAGADAQTDDRPEAPKSEPGSNSSADDTSDDSDSEDSEDDGDKAAKRTEAERNAEAAAEYNEQVMDPSFWLAALEQFLQLHALIAKVPAPPPERPSEKGDHAAEDDGAVEEEEEDAADPEDEQIGGTSSSGILPIQGLVEAGAIGFCFSALASNVRSVRLKAASCLQLFGQVVIRDVLCRERKQLVLLIRSVRGSLLEPGQKLPVLIASFAARALTVLLKPSNVLYPHVNSILLQRPWLYTTEVPLENELFNSGSPEYKIERGWIVRVMRSGVLEREDAKIIMRNHTYEKMMSFALTPEVVDEYMQQAVLDILVATARAGQDSMRQLLRRGIAVWIMEALAPFASPQETAAFNARQEQAIESLLELLEHAGRCWSPQLQLLCGLRGGGGKGNQAHNEALILGRQLARFAPRLIARCTKPRVTEQVISILNVLGGAASTSDFAPGLQELQLGDIARLITAVVSAAFPVAVAARQGLLQLVARNQFQANCEPDGWRLVLGWALPELARPSPQDASTPPVACLFLEWLAGKLASPTPAGQALCAAVDRKDLDALGFVLLPREPRERLRAVLGRLEQACAARDTEP